MAKTSGKFYTAMMAGSGIRRIDGIVRDVSEAGVTIDIKEPGRIRRLPTLIPMKDIICHTPEGPGFVVADGQYALEPVSGEVVEETEAGVVIKDVDGVEITFPSAGGGRARFIAIEADNKALRRSAVETRVQRLAEREEGSSGKSKKSKKAKDGDSSSKKKSSGKARRRRP